MPRGDPFGPWLLEIWGVVAWPVTAWRLEPAFGLPHYRSYDVTTRICGVMLLLFFLLSSLVVIIAHL